MARICIFINSCLSLDIGSVGCKLTKMAAIMAAAFHYHMCKVLFQLILDFPDSIRISSSEVHTLASP